MAMMPERGNTSQIKVGLKMTKISYLQIWGVCIRPLDKIYNAPAIDGYGLDTEIALPFEFRQGDGYLFTIITELDDNDKSCLQKFIENEPEDGEILRAAHLAPDGGIVRLSSDDLRYFEPGAIIEATPYLVEDKTEAQALLEELAEPGEYVEEFPAMVRWCVQNPEPDDFQLPF